MSSTRGLRLLVLAAWVAAAGGQVLKGPHGEEVAVTPQPGITGAATALTGQGKVQLKLCECERATGEPNGLSCDREGWFVSSFERQGEWMVGGGYVPLSHAICCRPCLPDELPADPTGRIPADEKPLAVVSLGCHPSTDSQPLRCEGNAGSFVTGFGEDLRVYTQADTYYPINSVRCCTPALLLGSGDAWELERCDCHDSGDAGSAVSCGGTTTDELLFGYIDYRMSPVGALVPVGPAQCCKVCLSSTVHPISECRDLNGCSNHGVCSLGQCQCLGGYAGADCSERVAGARGNIPPWAIALIVVSSCALAALLALIGGHAIQAAARAQREGTADSEAGDPALQPLLLRIDAGDCGSVGSTDTESDGEGEELGGVEARIDRVVHRLEQLQAREEAEAGAAGEGQQHQDGGESADGSAASAAAAADTMEAGGEGAGAEPEGLEIAGARAGPGSGAETPGGGASGKEDALCLTADPSTPLVGRDCCVCMVRAVQVVTIPCGHAAMCRRCSRRLKRCPVCRKDVVRRQRLFV